VFIVLPIISVIPCDCREREPSIVRHFLDAAQRASGQSSKGKVGSAAGELFARGAFLNVRGSCHGGMSIPFPASNSFIVNI
jgi:hypothetical protein